METNKRGGGTGVSQNKQLLTEEKDKEVASHRMEKETVAGAQKQMCTAADVHSSNTTLVTATAIVYGVFR